MVAAQLPLLRDFLNRAEVLRTYRKLLRVSVFPYMCTAVNVIHRRCVFHARKTC